ncbi:hypothetical protein BC832DRAFT_611001 [Gaertneriomyces semiglobifer]|nr:hypothetical protein BC832DRAFT_611001 [Gaertneriomyces semiglobifer]
MVCCQTEHLLTIPQVCEKFNVSVDMAKPAASPGLSAAEATKRFTENGPNQLSPPKRKHPFFIFMHHLLGLFNLLLLVAGIISYIVLGIDVKENLPNAWLGAILILVAFLNAFIEFYQGQKSAAILESFMNLIPAKCYVIREGRAQQISAAELVLGDIVYVRSGDKLPADLYLFVANEFKVDNSSLTGEADPQERRTSNTQQNPLEATNLVFNGTLAVNGEAYGIVIRTGDHTVIGQIASMTANEERGKSPMTAEIDIFVKLIASVAGLVAIVFFVLGLTAKGLTFSTSLTFAIGTFVSFVPEGLPATVTILLTFAAKRMASRNVLVKDLQGVETLGAITLLATDKTGTLTRNQMTVTFVWTGGDFLSAQPPNPGEKNKPDAPKTLTMDHTGANEIIHISALCSRARFESSTGPINERTILGDATESGLLRYAAAKIPDFDTIYDAYPKVLEIPFNSENKWAMTIHKKKHSKGSLMLYLKGAPERVLRICSSFYDASQNEAVPMTDEHKTQFDETYTLMASKGHRVLAFAALQLPEETYPADFVFSKEPINYPTTDLTFYGLISLEDPPKHGVREAIGHCREAGIKVMMVTGDHPLTAEAIGRKINMMLQETKAMIAKKRGVPEAQVHESEVNAIVIHGESIDALSDKEWENIFSKEEIIFARTSPKHKLQIVKRAQAIGHIVGVTGDGVNDSPALKKADLGIAMNVSGSDVSKEAAAMILVDDNFASCVSGIEEGRLIFQNLKKSVQYTVSHTMPQVWANLLYIIVPLPLPLGAMLILVTDLGFDFIHALTYAWDPPENRAGLMKLTPRKPVTQHSIQQRQRHREEDAMDGLIDPETGERKPQTFVHKMAQPFRKRFWKRMLESREEDVLVGKATLSWAYLEAGTLITFGCLLTYFLAIWYYARVTPRDLQRNGADWGTAATVTLGDGRVLNSDEQKEILSVGQAAYYISIFCQQCFNLFICKARLGMPYGKFMFTNIYNFVGILCGLCLTVFIVYVPGVTTAFGTSHHLSPLMWLVPIACGCVLFAHSILRTLFLQWKNPPKYSRDVVGLQMFPTRWSTRGG